MDRAVQWIRHGATRAHYASLIAGFLLVLMIDRHQWFYYDEWDFINNRLGGGLSALFSPHNEHWSTVPILVWRPLYWLFGLREYWPYIAVLATLHVALAHVLWRLARACGADTWMATLGSGVFLVLGVGFENLTWAFQIGFLLSTLTGLSGLLVLNASMLTRRRLIGFWALSVIGLMSSGVSVTMVAVAGAYVALRFGRRPALNALAIPVFVYAVWAAIEKPSSSLPPQSRTQYLGLGDYIWTGLRAAFEGSTGLTGAATILAASLVAYLSAPRWPWSPSQALGVVTAGGAVLLYAIAGVGRISLGVEQAGASRYSYIATALLLPSAGAALSALARRGRSIQIVVTGLLVFASVHGVNLLQQRAVQNALTKQRGEAVIVAAAAMIRSGHAIGADSAVVEPITAPDLKLGRLREIVAEGALSVDSVVPSPEEVIDAAASVETAMTDGPAIKPPARVRVVDYTGATVSAAVGGCADVTSSGESSRVRLTFDAGGSLTVRSADGGPLTLYMATPGSPTSFAPPVTFATKPARLQVLTVAADGAYPLVSFPAGHTTLCGLS